LSAVALAVFARCPGCGSENTAYWRLATASDAELAGRASYTLDRCRDCGTAAVAEHDDDGDLYVGGIYRPTPARRDALLEPLRRLLRRERLRFLRPLEPGARVFEVGAGDGRFLAALARAGYEAEGLEPYRAQAPSVPLVRRTKLEETHLPADSQDAVVLWHVLEHLADPAGALLRVREWLARDGVLVVAVPNLASLQAELGRDRWFHQDVPRHRTHFTKRGMIALLERCGFRVERVHDLLVDQSLIGMSQTLLNRVTRERNVLLRLVKGERLAGRSYLAVALLGPPLLLAAVALELYAGLRGRGGSFVVRARIGGGGA
jgi:predicted SAM-dependent methyltransferase